MSKVIVAFTFLLGIPLVLFFVEYMLAKKQSKLAVILPTIVLCFAVILPIVAITAIIMFVIYFVVRHLEKEKQEKMSEIEKMNIQDLD